MDLNRLYFDHQISLMRATGARDCHVREAHMDEAAILAQHIEHFQRTRGAPAAFRWEVRYRSDDQPRPSEQMPRSGVLHRHMLPTSGGERR